MWFEQVADFGSRDVVVHITGDLVIRTAKAALITRRSSRSSSWKRDHACPSTR